MQANNRHKTIMCDKGTTCKFGSKCNFAHGINEQSYINPLIGKLDNEINIIDYKKIYDALEKLYLSNVINKKVIQEICENLKYNPTIPKVIPENFIELYKIWHTLATFARNPKNNYSNKFKLYETEDDTKALMALRYVTPCKIDENKINCATAKICIYGKNCNFGHRSNGKQVCIKDLLYGKCDCNETTHTKYEFLLQNVKHSDETLSFSLKEKDKITFGEKQSFPPNETTHTQYPFIHLTRDFGHECLIPLKIVKTISVPTYEIEYPSLSANSIKTIVSTNKTSYTDICRNNSMQKRYHPIITNHILILDTPVYESNDLNPDIVGNDCQIAKNNPELFEQYEQMHPTYNITFTSWLTKDPLKSQAYNLVLFHNITFSDALYYVKNKLKDINITVNDFIVYVNKYKIKTVHRWIEVNRKLNCLDKLPIPIDTFKLNENNYYDYYITTEYYKHNTFDVYCQEKNDNWTIATKQGICHKKKNKVLETKKDKILTKITGTVITKCFE